MLCAFSMGAGSQMLQQYFGFMYSADGQLLFLAIAGNLAWSTGTLGIITAIFTNIHAATAWYTSRYERFGTAGLPQWTQTTA